MVREELARRFMPLVRRLASRYRGGREPLEDLVQVASLGLVKALDRFDPERGVAFTTYAAPTILGELRRHFRDRGWSVHVPRDLQERTAAVEKAIAEMPTKLGRSPSVREIAERLNLSDEDVLEAMEAGGAHHAVSIDALQRMDDSEGVPMVERLGDNDPGFDTVEYGAAIQEVLERAIRARPDGPSPAIRRGPHPDPDRRADRCLPDARLADPALDAAEPPRGGPGGSPTTRPRR